jgi:hypothetical protein
MLEQEMMVAMGCFLVREDGHYLHDRGLAELVLLLKLIDIS